MSYKSVYGAKQGKDKSSETYDNMNIQGQADLIAESWNIIKDFLKEIFIKGRSLILLKKIQLTGI